MAVVTNIDEIALVYARALLEECEARGGTAEAVSIGQELAELGELVRSNKQLGEFLRSPLLDAAKREASLGRILKGRVSDVLFRFAMVLAERGRAGRLADVAEAFDQLLQERLGRIEVDVYTVDGKADEATLATVRTRVKEAFGKEPVLHQYADANMIGGVKLRVGDQLIDGSIATGLRNMRTRIARLGGEQIRGRMQNILR
ncbi:MAG: ATP synthase F1 subunit delta [Phycisphaerales bacterium]|nr:ATP synthase F1 subunit delta [Phycisphaerales bacterium]